MAFPLKSGADLYNQQLIRAAIWNHGADPSETVTGLIYFNTSNSSAGKKLRLYTGSAWKTLAFEEDLDVANNAEFKALEDKVKLLSGEVDTDAIISNMKEVSNFLAGFAEDANLMSVLDGKLDKTGGTVKSADTAPLTIDTSDATMNSLLVKLGGTLKTRLVYHTTYGAYLSNDTIGCRLGIDNSGVPFYFDGSNKTLLHSGNVGEYNAGSATKLQTRRTIWGQSFDGTGDVSGDLALFQSGIYWHRDKAHYCIETEIHDNASPSLKIAHYGGISFYTKGEQEMLINNSGNVGIGTTSPNSALDISRHASEPVIALHYSHSRDNNLFGAKIALVDNGSYHGNLAFRVKTAASSNDPDSYYKDAMTILGENGNVGIGLTNPEHKLHVSEDIVANGTIACKGIAAEGDAMDMVDKVVLHIVPNGNQQTFTLTHGLGTREITICIYEVTSLGTNMILTDVEIVNDNSISVSFGNPPTENHMVVVMG